MGCLDCVNYFERRWTCVSELEELLREELEAELPPPPDVRYTQAAVRRRLMEQPRKPHFSEDGLAVASGIGILGLLIVASLVNDRLPLWLLAFPASALCLCPLLLIRRESR
jgi:hypothetical protein